MSGLDVAPEVAAALASGRPVVALESTIITHGMPFPANIETALAVEAEIRAGGAVPATMAIVAGRFKAGLSPHEIESLATARDVVKASRRDLAWVVATGQNGSTTVAGTMILAAMAGIRVFVTGGLGGVHRGATTTMDMSADLTELARTPVAVVCAGVKSILDVGLTLELLETLGVPVLGYGTDRFPAFYVADSGFVAPARVDDPGQAAAVIHHQFALGLGCGLVIANPIPPAEAMDGQVVEEAIAIALAEAQTRQITGKAVTPFLLEALVRLTQGRCLKANVALIKHNARLGAAIAVALAELES